jgi:hypothetical protein
LFIFQFSFFFNFILFYFFFYFWDNNIALTNLIIENKYGGFKLKDRMIRLNGGGYLRSIILKKGISNNGVMEVFVSLFLYLFI